MPWVKIVDPTTPNQNQVSTTPGQRGTSPILTRTPVLARMQVIPLVNRPPVAYRLTATGGGVLFLLALALLRRLKGFAPIVD